MFKYVKIGITLRLYSKLKSYWLTGCCKDDKRKLGQEIWLFLACCGWWRIWFWTHTWSKESSVHVFWRDCGSLCVEMLLKRPLFVWRFILCWWNSYKTNIQNDIAYLNSSTEIVTAMTLFSSTKQGDSDLFVEMNTRSVWYLNFLVSSLEEGWVPA